MGGELITPRYSGTVGGWFSIVSASPLWHRGQVARDSFAAAEYKYFKH
eukprot:SAG31_NODE_18655_length_627_cov_1.621212_1_plen_47_part_10